MDSATAKKPRAFREGLIRRLHDPLQLRVALGVVLLAAWYWLGFAPLSDRIAATTSALLRDRKRLALVTEVEALRVEAGEFADRLPPRSDPNEFVHYVLDGVRAGPLKLVSLNPEKPRDAGPYEVAVAKLELEGRYQDVETFLKWVENDKRLLRIDEVAANPLSKAPEILKVQLTVLGLMGAEAKPEAGGKPGPPPIGTKATPPRGMAGPRPPIPGRAKPGAAVEKPAGRPASPPP